jgi:hypothetical protein
MAALNFLLKVVYLAFYHAPDLLGIGAEATGLQRKGEECYYDQ